MKQLPVLTDTKTIFWKKGACSHTLFHIINRHFGNTNPAEERATDPLAGGLLQKGHQCGMLWGASLAVGKEAHKRSISTEEAIAKTIYATNNLLDSFLEYAKHINCIEITNCNFENRWSMAKYLLSGKFLKCFNLAEDWAPKAIAIIEESLDKEIEIPKAIKSCATEVLKKKNALEEESAMVAGLAGGLAMSGEGCGALAASIWHTTLLDILDQPTKFALKNPKALEKFDQFIKLTNGKFNCKDICGKTFLNLPEHTDYLTSGGCGEIIELLAD